ncbi:glycosyltransferase [bacterium]|nr:glycosyltransferase [bacterium]
MGLIKFIEDLWDITHLNFDKKIVLPEGIPDISEGNRKREFSKDKIKILMISDFTQFLDNYTPIFAISECNKESMDIRLDIYGQGSDLKDIRKCIKNQNCPNIRFIGGLQDFTSIYKDYDLFITSSYSFNAQMKTVEALRAGLPILLMDIKENGESEFIRGNGYVMPEDSIMFFRKTLKSFYENKSQLITMGQNSRKLFEERYLIQDITGEEQKKLKITHVARFASPHLGGIESFIKMFNGCIRENQVDIEVLCNSNDMKSSFDENGIFYNRAKYLFNFAANCISFEYIWKLSKIKTDIIIYHMPCIFAVIAHFLAKPKYKKMVVCYHSDIVGYDNIMKPFWKIYKLFLKQADIIHVQSPQMVENSLVKNFKDKAIMIPYLINPTTVFHQDNVEKIKQSANGKKIIFSLGRHVEYKGFIYLIKAMKKVENAILILGGKGALTPQYEKYILENNLEDKVKLVGKISEEELNNYYEASDIFVLPSIHPSETLAVVQLEAMKHAKPVINTWLYTGVNFVSVDKETGLTVEPENVEQLANAINELINNDFLRLQYGRNARKRVEELFDIEKNKDKYRKFYYG